MPFSYERKKIFASLPKTERAKSFVLGPDPKGKTFLYAHDRNIFIRDIENPLICDVYADHSFQTTVAKYAPSGYYIASGDVSGKIRIWDTTQAEHLLKYEYQPISGKIKDIAWSPDSKRVAICGEGRDQHSAAFLWDSGSSVGTLNTSNRPCNSIDFKTSRPFRLVVASEDMSVAMYEGPPFKHKQQIKDHNNFVNAVRYTPNGEIFASGSCDHRVLVYNGKDGEFVQELMDGTKAHKGGVYSLCFSPDSRQLMTASADKTVKLWDVETFKLVTTFTLGSDIEDQQLSCLWQGDYMLSGSLSGYINYLDKNNPSKPSRVIRGHNQNITAMAVSEDRKTIYTSCLNNKVMCWDSESGVCDVAAGKSHSNMVTSMCLKDKVLASVGMDDTIRFMDMEKKEFTDDAIGLDKQPLSVSTSGDKMAVGTVEDICLFEGNTQVLSEKINYKANAVHFSTSGEQLAVGGSDSKVHIFNVCDKELKEMDQLTTMKPVDILKYSPDGQYLACNASNKVLLWKVDGYTPVTVYWTGHNGRITVLEWSPDSQRIATGGVNSCIGVWDVNQPKTNNMIKMAHPKQVISAIGWLDSKTILSTSYDKCIKQWVV